MQPHMMITTRRSGRASGRGFLVTDFIGPELPDVLALADVVISRNSADTIAELTALRKPSVLIPLETSAGNEQEHNAFGCSSSEVRSPVRPGALCWSGVLGNGKAGLALRNACRVRLFRPPCVAPSHTVTCTVALRPR